VQGGRRIDVDRGAMLQSSTPPPLVLLPLPPTHTHRRNLFFSSFFPVQVQRGSLPSLPLILHRVRLVPR
jgi:hypothetical protein